MNKFPVFILLPILMLLGTPAVLAKRKPLPRVVLGKIEHAPTRPGLHLNPKTQQYEEYKLDGKIVYEEKSGNFLLQWNGMDGRRKTIIYKPANYLDAVVAAEVEYDAKINLYRYSYTLSNLPTSRRKLKTLYLETQASIDNVKAPDATWYSRALTDYLGGKLKAQRGWVWSQTGREHGGLPPGQKGTGFSFQSPGLPAIVKCYVEHSDAGRMKGVGEEPPEELDAALDRVSWKIPRGVTVGPTAPPERVDPVAFLRRLIEIVDVSLQQGWIESPQVAQELRRLLASSVAALEQGDTRQASVALRAVLAKVEQENQRTLLSEAYALFKFNLEFLLKQIDG